MLLSQAIIITTFIQCVQNIAEKTMYFRVSNVTVNLVIMYGTCQIIVVRNKRFVFFFFSVVQQPKSALGRLAVEVPISHTIRHTHTHTHNQTHTHTQSDTHTNTHTHTQSDTHTHTHTRGRTPLNQQLARREVRYLHNI